ncbi:DMT family transporter [Anaerosinus massiliensis]|uniref:DMT family transporter n=1 Tax=Massilibacillus massiliensis TaxID=1806837 RepID=UPI000AAFFE71|nr:DMT family transporter [Massilibacillus massiliensis]
MHFNFSTNIISLLMAALSGVLMAVQGSLNAVLSKVVGLLETTFIVHIIGTVFVVILLFGFRFGKGDLGQVLEAPWYSYLGGIVSIFIIYLVAASIPKVGVANATTAIIVGQVLTALLIDYLGLFGLEKLHFNWQQIIGVLFLAIGAKLLLQNL